ncbi:MAG: murein transglycosylase A [Desulforhopalus sp.]
MMPFFSDDLDTTSLLISARHQISYLNRLPADATVSMGDQTVDVEHLLYSIQLLVEKLRQHPDPDELNRFIQHHYLVYQAGGRLEQRDRRMLVTGYYEPLFAGSLKKEGPFTHPLYKVPATLAVRENDGQKTIGRYDASGQFQPFWSRADIETKDLLKGQELVYLKDPFDAFLLHVQGSGRILLPDGTIRSVRYAGSNGLQYNSVGKLLVDENVMALDEVSIPAIRSYLERNPDRRLHVLHHNPRYIFFSWGDDLGPRGSSGEMLTPGRSIALDTAALPGGTIAYLKSRRPLVDSRGRITGWTPIGRFVFAQDSGSAIKGTGRVDLFWGNGEYAEIAANHMKEKGKLYFLISRDVPADTRLAGTKRER